MAMGKVYDIMNRLTNNKPVIKIDEAHQYTVNNSKNEAIFIKQLSSDDKLDDIEKMDKIIEAAMGKEALDYIDSLNLPIPQTGIIVTAIMAAISDMEIEEVEEAAKDQAKKFRKK